MLALEKAKEDARAVNTGNGTLMDDSAFKNKIGALEAELLALEFTELRSLASVSAGANPGPESSIMKLKGTEIQQRISALNLESAGIYAAPWGTQSVGPNFSKGATSGYLGGRATTIFGGASEVQKDVIAKNVLDLGS